MNVSNHTISRETLSQFNGILVRWNKRNDSVELIITNGKSLANKWREKFIITLRAGFAELINRLWIEQWEKVNFN